MGRVTVGGALLMRYRAGLGTTFGYLYWYGMCQAYKRFNPMPYDLTDVSQWLILRIGYHVPATRKRDLFYAKLEREREEDQGTV